MADGTVKRLHADDILIAHDMSGHGHMTRGIGDESRVSMNVPLQEGSWLPKG